MRLLRLAAFATMAAFAAPAFAQTELDEAQAAEAMDFAMHDALFTVYHEAGHLLVGELGLSVLGKEEDAADTLAVIQILNTIEDPDELFNTLNDVADGWYYSAQETTGEGVDDLSYYDEHSLDIQRAYAVVCLMVGANPDEFAETADVFEIDPDRQDACAGTYEQAVNAWATELEPFKATSPGPEIPVTYEDAGDYGAYADELKARGILEALAEELRTNYALPGPVSLHAKLCGEANAFYDPGTHEITYCYELADDLYQRAINNIFSDGGEDGEGEGDAPAAGTSGSKGG